MNFSYEVTRNIRDGLEVKTVEGLGIEGRTFALELTTNKGNRGLWSNARVYEHKADGFKSTDLFGDWNKVLAENRTGRATEKVLTALHEQALTHFEQAIKDATAHTVAKLAKEAEQKAASDRARAERSVTQDTVAAIYG